MQEQLADTESERAMNLERLWEGLLLHGPEAAAAALLLALTISVSGKLIALRMATKSAESKDLPEIIRALSDLFSR
ncbi:hypothetical protein ACFY36_29055 [Actinoplanes sp. NPDC000266]